MALVKKVCVCNGLRTIIWVEEEEDEDLGFDYELDFEITE